MRKIIINGLFMMLFLMQAGMIYSQQKIFEQVTFPKFDQSNLGVISGITQDKEGYIWFITQNKGLYRYDGSQIVSYVHDAKDSASIMDAPLQSIAVDSDNVVWIGSLGGGLDKFDPATNKFTHFRHQAADAGSLANDTVAAILVDHENTVWIGTFGGLDLYGRKTGKFTHHSKKINDPTSLSNQIQVIYEDKEGVFVGGLRSTWFTE